MYLNQLGIVCSAGSTKQQVIDSLKTNKLCLSKSQQYSRSKELMLGLYYGELPDITLEQPHWHTRNNQFAQLAALQIAEQVEQAKLEFGSHRVGVIIGTSTSGISDNEPLIKQWALDNEMPDEYNYQAQEMAATADFIANYFAVSGPVFAISTACSSGAKALASAQRLIELGLCDVAIAGGVDTMCQLTVQGFSALEAVSEEQCNPFSKNRKGINIGEGAALFVLSKKAQGVALEGVGESSDAHHISAPEPNGRGAIACMEQALKSAKLSAGQIDYINLHGTATALNDQMESIAVNQVFGGSTLCSSTKSTTGHTLGAAGAVEAGIAWLLLNTEDSSAWLPVHHWDEVKDETLPALNFVSNQHKIERAPRYILSNSFAFGGNNISLVLGKII